ncbi:MAG TPA: nicotinate-nucleotide adenylyltransferase [Actinomycetota bacterium]|nr:nicotinate-nucleotide adenylyltransferase [Actinomycetota bacterium]
MTKPARLGVFGGTFDPIHIGHLIAAAEAMHSFSLDRVLFVPAGRPWQKDSFSEAEDRYTMTVLGTAAHERFAVSRTEVDRTGPTYTADTMEGLRDFYGSGTGLYFIIGADAVQKVDTWRGVERLVGLAEFIAVARPGAGNTLHPLNTSILVHKLAIPGVDISSTDVRARVADGRPIDFLVPAPVARYIRRSGLYGAEREAGSVDEGRAKG